MKKHKTTIIKNAIECGLIKNGDNVWVQGKVYEISENTLKLEMQTGGNAKIRIPIPEPKPIDFGESGRILKSSTFGTIIQTTGLQVNENFFSAFVLDKANSNWAKGQTSDYFLCDEWQDITDTYNK